MIDKERVLSHLRIIRTWAAVGIYHDGIEKKCCEDVAQWADDVLELMEALDVSPEELERLKLCRLDCKVDCLLEQNNKDVTERDELLMKQKALDAEEEKAQELLHSIWDYAKVNEIGWMQKATSDTNVTLHLLAAEVFRLRQEPRLMSLEDVLRAENNAVPVWCEFVDCVYGSWRMGWKLKTEGKREVQHIFENPFERAVVWESEYKKGWRCWTAIPTDKQRKVTLWEG